MYFESRSSITIYINYKIYNDHYIKEKNVLNRNF